MFLPFFICIFCHMLMCVINLLSHRSYKCPAMNGQRPNLPYLAVVTQGRNIHTSFINTKKIKSGSDLPLYSSKVSPSSVCIFILSLQNNVLAVFVRSHCEQCLRYLLLFNNCVLFDITCIVFRCLSLNSLCPCMVTRACVKNRPGHWCSCVPCQLVC